MKRNVAVFVIKQHYTIGHACIRTKMGLEGSIKDQKGLVGVQMQQVGEWIEIQIFCPAKTSV
jgi:hypothetical protein